MNFPKIKNIIKKILPVGILAMVTLVAGTEIAHAQVFNVFAMFGSTALNIVLSILAYFAYGIATLSAWFLYLCGSLLNIAMQLTVNLGAFIDMNESIYTVWAIIRDLTMLFLIFAILWTAMRVILSLDSPGIGNWIKTIVIAGVLINFSFFFARVLIDASNIVSLQFFNAIAPNQTAVYSKSDSIADIIKKAAADRDGGFSGIFASTLQITRWYDNKGDFDASGIDDAKLLTRLILVNYTAAIVMVLAGVSFLGAAAAALWRTVVLVFLLGFSAVWIASMAVPQLKKVSGQWWGHFKSNLTFLPVYLGFLYVSVFIISKMGLSSSAFYVASPNANTAIDQYLVLFVVCAIVLFFINIPLLAAISVAGATVKWTESLSKWSVGFARGATIGAATGVAGYGAKRTVGAAASAANEAASKLTIGKWNVGNSLVGQKIRSATFGKVAGAKFGTASSFKDYEEAKKKAGKLQKDTLRQISTSELFEKAKTVGDYKNAMDKMKSDDRLKAVNKVKDDEIKLRTVLKHLKKSEFEAISKSDDFDDSAKEKIKKARKEAMHDAVNLNEVEVVKHMLKEMETGDIMGLDDKVKQNPNLIAHYTPDNLKKMGEAGLDPEVRKNIKAAIQNWVQTNGKPHRGYGAVSNDWNWKDDFSQN